jgi:hypothetical protein
MERSQRKGQDMNRSIRRLTWIACALAAAAVIAPVAQAGHPQPLYRGTSDFALPTQADRRDNVGALTKRGCGDFGLAWSYESGCVPVPAEPAKAPAVGGFQWGDAVIGAAAMLGIVLLVGGIGLGLIVARNQRRPLQST